MCYHGIQRFFLVLLFLFAVGSPAFAELTVRPHTAAVRSAAHSVLLADVGNLGGLITTGGRARVVQFCVVVVCLALFILMRKFNE